MLQGPRNRRIAAGFVLLLGLATAVAAGAMGIGERHETRHQIDDLEDRWRESILTRNVATAEMLLSDDFMAITANGMLQSKEETIASLRNGQVQFKSIDITDRKVRFYGMTAIVTSRAAVEGSGPNGDFSGNYRYTHVYARDPKGVWRIVSFEASRIREAHDKDKKDLERLP
jgi:ketosteroid isomerase-like protein